MPTCCANPAGTRSGATSPGRNVISCLCVLVAVLGVLASGLWPALHGVVGCAHGARLCHARQDRDAADEHDHHSHARGECKHARSESDHADHADHDAPTSPAKDDSHDCPICLHLTGFKHAGGAGQICTDLPHLLAPVLLGVSPARVSVSPDSLCPRSRIARGPPALIQG